MNSVSQSSSMLGCQKHLRFWICKPCLSLCLVRTHIFFMTHSNYFSFFSIQALQFLLNVFSSSSYIPLIDSLFFLLWFARSAPFCRVLIKAPVCFCHFPLPASLISVSLCSFSCVSFAFHILPLLKSAQECSAKAEPHMDWKWQESDLLLVGGAKRSESCQFQATLESDGMGYRTTGKRAQYPPC